MLLGTYEKACKPWSPQTTPWDFGHELLPPDLDRIAPSLEVGFQHFPAHREGRHQAGHQRPLHLRARRQSAGRPGAGPDAISGAPARVMAGFSQGGGVGLALSNWMVDGDPGLRRLGHGRRPLRRMGDACATPTPRCARTIRAASRIRFPNEELPAARPAQTTPLYDTMIARGRRDGRLPGASRRRSGSRRKGAEPKDVVSFHRSNDFAHVGDEVPRGARAASASPRSPTSPNTRSPGRAPRRFLDRLMTNRMPQHGPHRADADAQRARQADRRLHHRQGRRRSAS